jgi:hypothetical protein
MTLELLYGLLFISIVAGMLYCIWIRPKLLERRAIKENSAWMMKLVDSAHAEIASRNTNKQKVPIEDAVVMSDIRELWGFPPKECEVLEGIYSLKKVGGPWDYAVHIHEASEQYLGSEEFHSLEKRFGSVPGVDECVQDDREVFLIKTKALNVSSLRKAIWQKFLEAATPNNVTESDLT